MAVQSVASQEVLDELRYLREVQTAQLQEMQTWDFARKNGEFPAYEDPYQYYQDDPTQGMSKKEMKKLEKIKRKEKDYFYVMRKLPCFLIFLMCLVVFVVSSAGVINSFVELPEMVSQFTAITANRDITSLEAREAFAEDSEEEDESEYIDKSVYLSAGDMFLLSLNDFVAMSFLSEEKLQAHASYIEMLEKASEELDSEMAVMIRSFAPLALALSMIASLIAMFTSLFGVFGKRIYKGFFFVALLMIISVSGLFLSGLIDANLYNYEWQKEMGLIEVEGVDPEDDAENTRIVLMSEEDEDEETEVVLVTSLLSFDGLMNFIMDGAFFSPAETEEDVESTAPKFGAGFGFFALAGGAVVVLILSLFAKKRVPYSVFDR